MPDRGAVYAFARAGFAACALGGIAACSAAEPAPATLSDADVLRLDAAPFDARALANRRVVLGVHQGALLVADHPCSDVCPQYTVRVLHYDVQQRPLETCEAQGGARVSRMVPFAIAVRRQDFCVPKVLLKPDDVKSASPAAS